MQKPGRRGKSYICLRPVFQYKPLTMNQYSKYCLVFLAFMSLGACRERNNKFSSTIGANETFIDSVLSKKGTSHPDSNSTISGETIKHFALYDYAVPTNKTYYGTSQNILLPLDFLVVDHRLIFKVDSFGDRTGDRPQYLFFKKPVYFDDCDFTEDNLYYFTDTGIPRFYFSDAVFKDSIIIVHSTFS